MLTRYEAGQKYWFTVAVHAQDTPRHDISICSCQAETHITSLVPNG
jgi:hypothetical protein